MKLRAFAVRDEKAEAFLRPFFAETRGLAIRSFSDAVNDKSSPFFAHSADYTLFEIGSFQVELGVLVPEVAIINLGNAVTFKREDS